MAYFPGIFRKEPFQLWGHIARDIAVGISQKRESHVVGADEHQGIILPFENINRGGVGRRADSAQQTGCAVAGETADVSRAVVEAGKRFDGCERSCRCGQGSGHE